MLLPPNCLTCDAVIDLPGRLCPDCFAKTGFITEPCCVRCGVPFATLAQAGPDRVCASCALRPPDYDRARAAFRYDAQARRMILPMKYADRTELARALAVHMARAGAALLREADLLVPVPLHRGRLRRRRYNQAALLAFAVGRIARKPTVPDALRRTRSTAALADKTVEERRTAVASAIDVPSRRGGLLRDRRVVLIDDVLTSGATANACALALRTAGVRDVDVLVAARVPFDRDRNQTS